MVRANEVIELRMIRSQKDLDAYLHKEAAPGTEPFEPEFTHQLFGQNENIFGFKDLSVRIYYSSGKLSRFMTMKYSEKLETKDELAPDDVLGIIRHFIPGSFTSNIDQFSKELEDEPSFKPFGEKLKQHEITSDGVTRTYEVYRAHSSTPGFSKYHENMQTFLLLFIDGASYIDFDDDKWDFFVVYEKTGGNLSNGDGHNGLTNGSGSVRYHFVGYTSVYRYYAYPANFRPRISQVLILPPFQRQGLGSVMLNTIYDWFKVQPEVRDITVEDPSTNFVCLRDYVDSKNCMSLPSFQKESLLKGWTEDMSKEAQTKLKLNKKQTRRVYEILKLKAVRKQEELYHNYRLEVKNRLNAPFVKMNGKQESAVNPQEQAVSTSKEHRIEELKNLYAAVEEEYLTTISKLEKDGL